MKMHVDLCMHMFTQNVVISLLPICFLVLWVHNMGCSAHCFGCITWVAASSGEPVVWPELPVGFLVEAAPGHRIQL